ncbi:MAG: hypothetical protein LUD27_00700 [Clostridia bacterium]|nr:hypothetical protein [Clostridia bacterium]
MKVYTIAQSGQKPDTFSVNALLNGISELRYASDVEEISAESEDDGTAYSYKEYIGTAKITGYDDLISELVGLIYTPGDEIALMRKGLADSENEEYAAYLEYVASCKAFAKEYYGTGA